MANFSDYEFKVLLDHPNVKLLYAGNQATLYIEWVIAEGDVTFEEFISLNLLVRESVAVCHSYKHSQQKRVSLEHPNAVTWYLDSCV